MAGAEEPLSISRRQVEELLDIRDLFAALEDGLACFSRGPAGGVVQPVRSVVPVSKHRGFLGVMPGYSEKHNSLVTKLVSFYPDNKTEPTHQAHILVFDPTCGSLRAIMDGEHITAIRTAVASAVASKYLAADGAKVLALVGAGTQARSHYTVFKQFYDFTEVRIWSMTYEHAQQVAKDLGEDVIACRTISETVKDADIICTVSFATEPIVTKDMVKVGAHINAVGACRPDWQELSPDLVHSCDLYVDSRDACMKEAGDVILAKAEILGEIGDVINKTVTVDKQHTTIFKSVGMAIEDVMSAQLVYDRYKKTQTTS